MVKKATMKKIKVKRKIQNSKEDYIEENKEKLQKSLSVVMQIVIENTVQMQPYTPM